MWNTKDLPVLETARSLIGVEMKLGEGESREYDFSMQVPQQMPPSHVGKAWAFEWKMVVNVGVKLGREERVEEVVLPIRVWSRVSCKCPSCGASSGGGEGSVRGFSKLMLVQ